MCEHLNFVTEAAVSRITKSETDNTIIGFSADVKIRCADCNEVFVFLGMPGGYSPSQPMCSIDRAEARLPIAPQGDFLETVVTSRQTAMA